MAELQSDDYHMDRPLFYACQNARELFCKNVQSGEGRIYECLIKNSQAEDMDIDVSLIFFLFFFFFLKIFQMRKLIYYPV